MESEIPEHTKVRKHTGLLDKLKMINIQPIKHNRIVITRRSGIKLEKLHYKPYSGQRVTLDGCSRLEITRALNVLLELASQIDK